MRLRGSVTLVTGGGSGLGEAISPRFAGHHERLAAACRPVGRHTHISDASWRRKIDIHLSGTFYCTRAALGMMGRGASIVHMSSVGAG
jgi:NAD(P)-dependent dehydrogenase (short-subunit alcohol dehydrogenase family)